MSEHESEQTKRIVGEINLGSWDICGTMLWMSRRIDTLTRELSELRASLKPQSHSGNDPQYSLTIEERAALDRILDIFSAGRPDVSKLSTRVDRVARTQAWVTIRPDRRRHSPRSQMG